MPSEDRPLRIVFLTSEFDPLAKVGGLADAVSGLAGELARLGHKVTILLPAYRRILDAPFRRREMHLIRPLTVPLGTREEAVELTELQMEQPGLRVILVDHPASFDRPGIYDDPATGEGYPDNDRRSILFQRAVIEGLKAIDLRPDVLHLHDYQTGLVSTYLKTVYRGDRFFHGVGTLFTIHNLGYQGIFPADVLGTAGLSMDLFYPTGPLEFWGRVNFMKAAIVFADRLTTVSPRYAEEIQTIPELGYGLEGVLRSRSSDLKGILNGIDYRIWDPATDDHVPAHYSASDLSGKAGNKAALLDHVRLPGNGDAPLIGVISRLVDQKGFDLLSDAIPGLLAEGFHLVVLGTGQRKYEERMMGFAGSHPGQVAFIRGFDNPLAHLIEAGSDFLLMPSRYEPCGLNQIISLRYGTIPIVRETGGLADTVEPVNLETGAGTGFLFRQYTAEALLGAAREARQVYGSPKRLADLRRRAMAQDFSWSRSAREYVALYREIVDGPRRSDPA